MPTNILQCGLTKLHKCLIISLKIAGGKKSALVQITSDLHITNFYYVRMTCCTIYVYKLNKASAMVYHLISDGLKQQISPFMASMFKEANKNVNVLFFLLLGKMHCRNFMMPLFLQWHQQFYMVCFPPEGVLAV